MGAGHQYIWSPRYIDAPICRDRDADGDGQTGHLGQAYSGLEQRVYYTTDRNMNVTTLTDPSDNVVERYAYAPYGNPRAYDASWTPRGSGGAYDNPIRFCGYYYDHESGLYHVRFRMYQPLYGRWMQRDPLGYVDEMSLYEYVGSMPTLFLDPLGLEIIIGIHTSGVRSGGHIGEGHAYLSWYDTVTGTYGTIGFWPATDLTYNAEVSGEGPIRSRYAVLDARGLRTVRDQLRQYQDAEYLHLPLIPLPILNCADFADDAWEAATGENVESWLLDGPFICSPTAINEWIGRMEAQDYTGDLGFYIALRTKKRTPSKPDWLERDPATEPSNNEPPSLVPR